MSQAEENLMQQIRDAGLPEPVREFRFSPPRRWRADFAWPDRMLLVEVEGGLYVRGGHTRGSGYEKNCSKYNAAGEMGFRVFRFSPRMVRIGEAIELIRRLLEGE